MILLLHAHFVASMSPHNVCAFNAEEEESHSCQLPPPALAATIISKPPGGGRVRRRYVLCCFSRTRFTYATCGTCCSERIHKMEDCDGYCCGCHGSKGIRTFISMAEALREFGECVRQGLVSTIMSPRPDIYRTTERPADADSEDESITIGEPKQDDCKVLLTDKSTMPPTMEATQAADNSDTGDSVGRDESEGAHEENNDIEKTDGESFNFAGFAAFLGNFVTFFGSTVFRGTSFRFTVFFAFVGGLRRFVCGSLLSLSEETISCARRTIRCVSASSRHR